MTVCKTHRALYATNMGLYCYKHMTLYHMKLGPFHKQQPSLSLCLNPISQSSQSIKDPVTISQPGRSLSPDNTMGLRRVRFPIGILE